MDTITQVQSTLKISEVVNLVATIVAAGVVIITIRKDLKLIKSVIFGERGKLNVIDQQTCREHQDIVYGKIRNNEMDIRQLSINQTEMQRDLIKFAIRKEVEDESIENK